MFTDFDWNGRVTGDSGNKGKSTEGGSFIY